ncbi:MAG TPA: FAD-dependent oxidoreductase [Acidimicrobiales bacterium]|jgi:thioredoxin reductase (NADPH)|nr:FAD-dependent oxidoreductase [Acidimicrobiales bacterium]
MTERDRGTRSALAIADPSDQRFPVFSPEVLEELAEFGEHRELAAGDALYRAGEARWDFYVLIEGEVEVVRDDESEQLVVVYGPGQFVGELGLLTGQRTYLTARATRNGLVLVIPHDAFRRLMATKPTISDTIFGALIGRRETLRTTSGGQAVQIMGSRFSRDALALRTFAARNRLAYAWIDLEEADDVGVLLASRGLRPSDTPVVITPTGILRHPTPGEFAEQLGLTYHPIPGRTFDLVVIGVGPAGLAASVYGASEGLDTVSLDAVGPGGQAGSSSRIENYAGFPNGISGGDLAARTAVQAQRLGAWLVSPCEVSGLRVENGFQVVSLVDQSEVPTRAVIVATGARYQRLAISNLEQFEGNGVYYAATDLEARSCSGSDVVVVGGGNSAGQAALYLSQEGSRVSIVVRRSDLSSSMSKYLIDRIAADPTIEVLTDTEVRALNGDTHLESVVFEHTPSEHRYAKECVALFCFIGAEPATSWLNGAVAVDEKGFVLTDRSLPAEILADYRLAGREALPFETSAPGVFAVGDVRLGSMKRVAAAVGEGSSAVRSVHEYLATYA